MDRGASPLGTLGLAMAATAILLVPAALHGRPFLFFDSEHYFLIGRAIWAALQGLLGLAPALPDGPISAAAEETARALDEDGEGGLAVIAGGRSPVYAVLLHGLTVTAGLWSVALFQAGICAWLIVRTCDLAFGQRRARATLAVIAGLTGLTPLGFHVGFLMPDIFAGIGILALLLLAFDARAPRGERLVHTGLVAFSLTMHTTILLLAAGVFALLLLTLAWRPLAEAVLPGSRTLSALALAAALGVQVGYPLAAEHATGSRPEAPPFLTARVIADGPGARHLSETCTGRASPHAACAFADRAYADHNDVLWGAAGTTPNFAGLDRSTQAAIQAEELTFVRQVVATHLAAQATASAANAMAQFVAVGIEELHQGAARMRLDPAWSDSAILDHAPGLRACRADPSACRPETAAGTWWNGLILAATLTGTLAFYVRLAACFLPAGLPGHAPRLRLPGALPAGPRGTRLACLLVVLALVLIANAALCGILSGVHDRYQARLAWLAPLLLLAFAQDRRAGDRTTGRF